MFYFGTVHTKFLETNNGTIWYASDHALFIKNGNISNFMGMVCVKYIKAENGWVKHFTGKTHDTV